MKRKFYFDDREIELIISALSEYEEKYRSQLAYYDELPDYEHEAHEDAFCEVLAKFNCIMALATKISHL